MFNKLFFYVRDKATFSEDDIINVADLVRNGYFLWNKFQQHKRPEDVQDIVKLVHVAQSIFLGA